MLSDFIQHRKHPMTNTQPNQHRVICSISHALWDTDLIASRLVLAFGELFWGVMLLWPGSTFDRPVYSHMGQLLPEVAWGALFLASSATQTFIVVSQKLHNKFARCFAAWNALFWGYTVISMLMSVYPPPAAIGGEVAIAIAAFWIWVRPYILAEGYKRAGHP